MSSATTEVTLGAFGRLERELRDNLSDQYFQFTTITLDKGDESPESVEVLEWITEMKVKMKMKVEIEGKVKQRQEVERFWRENKIKAIPNLQ